MAIPNFETTIGLEVHIELKTNSKAMSSSPVKYGDTPNVNTNVIDWGYPGVLPQANKKAVEFGMIAGLIFNSDITRMLHWDRKNYFYPDNPKAYQITQQFEPLATNGYLTINNDGINKKIRITEIHVEEDAGKNINKDDGYSYIDLNRQGTPLIEIVGAPDLSTPEEAYTYLEELRKVIQFSGISDVKMQEGSMRVDANISIRPIGSTTYGQRIELKNLNSLNYVKKALEYEENRLANIYLTGGSFNQETRRYDSAKNITVLMREKEQADDYRYFPEPDLTPLLIDDKWIEDVKNKIPQSAKTRKEIYENEYNISPYVSEVLTQTLEMADFFEEVINNGAEPIRAGHYIIDEVNAFLNETHYDLKDTKITAQNIANIIKMIDDNIISTKMAKRVFKAVSKGIDAIEFVEENDLKQISDINLLTNIINEIINNNEQAIIDYHNGKDRVVGSLIGEVMKKTKGNANPIIVNDLVIKKLNDHK